MNPNPPPIIHVMGSGICAQAAALALARAGFAIVLDAPPPQSAPQRDLRAYALSPAICDWLNELKIWEGVRAEPVLDMRITDTDAQIVPEAPEAQGTTAAQGAQAGLHFSADAAQQQALAWIAPSESLLASLARSVRLQPGITLRSANAPMPGAALRVICEGKASATRQMLGVPFQVKEYGHSALAAIVMPAYDPNGVAWQWFRHPDVLALLPLPRQEADEHGGFALVWSQPAEQAANLRNITAEAFEAQLNDACAAPKQPFGRLRLTSESVLWPLSWSRALRTSGEGWVLVGDAAHVIHPLAGQGLNLGLADVMELVRTLEQARREQPWRAIGDARLLARYERARAAQTWIKGAGCDALWGLFSAEEGIWPRVRRLGVQALQRSDFIKNFFVRGMAHTL